MSLPKQLYSPGGAAVPIGRVTPAPGRLTLVVNVPATIALQYSTGKETVSRLTGEPQMMFTLTDGRRAWFPLEVGQRIEALNLVSREPFIVCRHGSGEYDVKRADSSPAKNQPAQESSGQLNGHDQPHDTPRAQPPAPFLNGAGETIAAIYAHWCSPAIDIALAAAEIARGKGLQIAPVFEDVRSIATALFIQDMRGRQ